MLYLASLVVLSLISSSQAGTCSSSYQASYDVSTTPSVLATNSPNFGGLYYIAPCGEVPSALCSDSSGQTCYSAGTSESDGLGQAAASSWSPYNGEWSNGAVSVNSDLNDFQYTACDPDGNTDSVTVNFVCNKGDDTLSLVTEPPLPGNGPCIFVFEVDSSVVCAAGGGGGDSKGKKGLSGGWIFVIILVVAFSVYFIVGTLFNRCRGGKTGAEMVPNIAFWRDLPSLVKDGCGYCLSKCKGLCGIKSAESASNYSTM